jgi:hypothetical protein
MMAVGPQRGGCVCGRVDCCVCDVYAGLDAVPWEPWLSVWGYALRLRYTYSYRLIFVSWGSRAVRLKATDMPLVRHIALVGEGELEGTIRPATGQSSRRELRSSPCLAVA